MTDEKWENLISMIDEKFGLGERKEEEAEGGPGQKEIVEFEGPMGKMRLERTVRPLVIDKKTQYSRRIGGDVSVDYVYSETEKSCQFKAYKWNENDGEWEKIDAGALV